jgi:hypothetical protein
MQLVKYFTPVGIKNVVYICLASNRDGKYNYFANAVFGILHISLALISR